jgi:hypothetical protein
MLARTWVGGSGMVADRWPAVTVRATVKVKSVMRVPAQRGLPREHGQGPRTQWPQAVVAGPFRDVAVSILLRCCSYERHT